MKSLAPPYQNVVSVAYKPSSVIGGHLSRPIVTDGFKRNPESIDGPSQSLFRFLLRAGFTSRTSRQAAGELLPHLSTLTRQACGISLLHFPWGRPRRALPGALPCGARTFLTPFGARPPGSLTNRRILSHFFPYVKILCDESPSRSVEVSNIGNTQEA